MTQQKGLLLVISLAAAFSAGASRVAYPEMPMIIPLVFAWIAGAAWMASRP